MPYEYTAQDVIDDTRKALLEAKSMITYSCAEHREHNSKDIAARWHTLEGCFAVLRFHLDRFGSSKKLDENLALEIDYADTINISHDMMDGLLDGLIQNLETYEYLIRTYMESQIEEAA